MSQSVTTLSLLNEHKTGPEIQKLQLATLFERFARKKRTQNFLGWMGLDPRQFVIFLELFRTLSEREEFIGSVGVNRFNVMYLSYWSGLMTVYTLVFLIFGRAVPPAPSYLAFELSLTFAVTFLVFMREAANSLFNPVEASMLAHAPIHAPTYAAAKIVHIFIAVLYLVSGLNLFPAFVGGAVSQGARPFWFLTHFGSAILIGLWTAFIICAFYGLMRRLVPADMLKNVAKWIQILAMTAFVATPIFFKTFLSGIFAARYENTQWTWLPLTWFLEIGRLGCQGSSWRLGAQGAWAVAASILIIWFGFRSFSGTYVSEVASTVVHRSRKAGRRGLVYRCLMSLTSAVTRGATGLGAFCFICQMIRREKLFWRAILIQTWILFLAIFVVILTIARSGFGPASHIFPHLLGLIIWAICINLPTTVYGNASWIYLTAPIGNPRAFAAGIVGSIWMIAVALPHAVLLIIIGILTNWRDAVSMTGFNLIVASLYLAFGINMISGLPFSSPANELKNMAKSIYIQVCGLMALAFPIVIQINLWRNPRYTLNTAIVMAIGICLVLYVNLNRLEKEISWRLYLLKMGPNQIFREY